MAYLVKPLTGETLRMEMAQIREALERGTITPLWMARDERQDFWYSVAMLIGKTPAEPLRTACPHCHVSFMVRHIDIGLPGRCPKCGGEAIVPDPFLAEQRVVDEVRLREANREAWHGFLWLALGSSVTLASYLFGSTRSGGFVLWWGPITIGLAMFLVKFKESRELKRKLRRPPKGDA